MGLYRLCYAVNVPGMITMFFPTSALFSGNKQIMTVMTHHSCFQLTLCMLGIFAFFFVVCRFFSKSTFSKNSYRYTFKVSNSLDPDQARHLSGLILVQTFCKSYQQTTLVGKELTKEFLSI